MSDLEKDIQKRILERLAFVREGFFWRENSGMIRAEYKGKTRMWKAGFPGIADIIGIYKGVFVAIEVKRPGKKLSVVQGAFLQKIKDHNGIAFMCDNDAEVVDALEFYYTRLPK